MKTLLDTADVDAIRRAHDTGLLDGVTTNPSIVAKANRRLEDVIEEICGIVTGPVSVESASSSCSDLIADGERLASIAPNVVIKMPMTVEGLQATRVLEHDKGIKVNVTMIFSPTQAALAMKTGASFVSIVLSRLDAVGNESEVLVRDAALIKRNYGFSSEIIAGSMKTQNHVIACLRAGVDIVTVPESLFLQMFQHPLTDAGLAQFAKDWDRTAS